LVRLWERILAAVPKGLVGLIQSCLGSRSCDVISDVSETFFQDRVECFHQDQDQDFVFCFRGTSKPRLWSQGLHH